MSNLSHYDNFILSMVDGNRSFESIRRDSGLSTEELRQILISLHRQKFIYWPILRTNTHKPSASESKYPIPKRFSTRATHTHGDTKDLASNRQTKATKESSTTLDIIPTADINKLHLKHQTIMRDSNSQTTKAAQLFNQAMLDQRNGKLSSAKLNVKLALSFHPDNLHYAQVLEQLQRQPVPKNKGANLSSRPYQNQVLQQNVQTKRPVNHSDKTASTQKSTNQAQMTIQDQAVAFYKEASNADKLGDPDHAIYLLQQAIRLSEQPKFYNRLGVILATRKGEYTAAQKNIEKAIALSPDNKVYEKNLHKVIALAAANQVDLRQATKNISNSLLSFLGLRKQK